jgi:hypothetical protein
MFLEMAKDMPRGRQESLARLLVPMVAVMAVALGLLVVPMVGEARVAQDVRQQVEQQARDAGVLFVDDRLVLPRSGEQPVAVVVDGRRVDGLIAVDGDTATLLVPAADGELVPAAPGN